ncbi:hypothetical protein MMC20_008140 [Loxospora ochrophaea]|nr:hypothetical protein [Loxospora ochrophaea]
MYFLGSTLLASVLLPTALASPHHEYGLHGRRVHHSAHHLSGGPFPTGRPIPSGTAPYGLANGTAGPRFGSTGALTSKLTTETFRTLTSTIFETVFMTQPTDQGGHSGSESTAGAASGACDLATATLTVTPTVTVTANAGSTFTGSPLSSLPAGTSAVGLSLSPLSSQAAPLTTAESQQSSTSTITTDTSESSAVSTSEAAAPVSSEAPSSSILAPQSSDISISTQAQTSVTAQPSIASSSAALATATSTAGATSGTKRGILASGTDQNELVSAFDNSSSITWLCNWYSAPPPNLGSHIEFVPQDYGKQSDVAPDYVWTANAKTAVAENTKYFLSFGEPETANNELYMDPQDAVNLFIKDLQPYADEGVKVGAPAVLQPDPDLEWLSQFLDLCETAKCDISFIAIHWFWSATEDHIQAFKDTVNNATSLAKGKPVWVDNFQASGSNADQQTFLNGVLPWLEQNTAVERYAYVSPDRSTGTGFLNADGSMSSLGEFYANFPTGG